MRIGLVGLPNAGKSTVFNMVTKAGAETGHYPFTTADRNVGRVAVPDPRLEAISQIIGSARAVPTMVSIVDIAGLVPGAHKGEGLGNRFLGHIREMDAIAHVLRCFNRADVVRSEGVIDPLADADLVETELILADHETVLRRLEGFRVEAKSARPQALARVRTAEGLLGRLAEGQYLRRSSLSPEEASMATELNLLTILPMLYVLNTEDPEGSGSDHVVEVLKQRGGAVVELSAAFEDELGELDAEERRMFLEDAGMESAGRDRLIRAAHELLGLITFFSGNEKETRAWSIVEGSSAVEAAGLIHTDMARGFIRAEVIAAEALIEIGSRGEARSRGLLRVEGRDYRVCDGDVMHILFNA